MISLITILFVLGYFIIIFENKIKIDKAIIAILTGITLWAIIALSTNFQSADHYLEFLKIIGNISNILFFLLGAMAIVELVDMYHGFKIISKWITTTNKFSLLFIICLISFFLSSVLDNLTTTIVMISIVKKLIIDHEDRFWFVSMIIIAANSGGAWSPIGDITTTMLWIDNKVSSWHLIKHLLVPSLLSVFVPLLIISQYKRFKNQSVNVEKDTTQLHTSAGFYLFVGIALLIMVPVFKSFTHLPPFMGMIGALGLIWLFTEIDHLFLKPISDDQIKPTVKRALSRIEIPSILFFFGILLSIAALEYIGQLSNIGQFLETNFNNYSIVAFVLGLLSSVIDNVPLVAGAIGMYRFPLDHLFWHELAYAAGTGGSVLIIGSAAGVVAMGIEKINYSWYFKRMSLLALLGYLSGWIYIYFI